MTARLASPLLLVLALGATGCRGGGIAIPPDPVATMTSDGWPLGPSLAVTGNAISVTDDRSFEKTIGNERRGSTEEMVIPFRTGRITLIVGPQERRGSSSGFRRFNPAEILAWRDAEEQRLKREGGYRKIAYRSSTHRVKSGGTTLVAFTCRRWDYTLNGEYRIMFVFDREPYASAAEIQAPNRLEAEALARRLYPAPEPGDARRNSANASSVR